MTNLVQRILGVPLRKARVRAVVAEFARTRPIADMRATVSENLAHITGKSGALLQAQGIFFVVATYVLGEGWPPYLAFSSMLLLIAAALIVMTNLRSVYIGPTTSEGGTQEVELEMVVRSAILSSRRGAVFNIALYLTFLSILLLGAGAIAVEV